MLAKSIQGYFGFGACVRYLQDVPENAPIHGDSFVLKNLTAFFGQLDELGLQVTKRASYDLSSLAEELKSLPESAKLTMDQAGRLNRLMRELRKTLSAEIKGFEAYVVTPKRLDVKKLLDGVDELFAPNVFDFLPEIAIHDFMEAGKCIAFERATAAAFHLLRGTEAVLRHYYCLKIGRNRIELMWGPIVVDLRKRRKTRRNHTLHNNLDNIRQSFRNPTQHPDKIYDIQEVQDLFGLCVDVVNRMIRDIHPQKTAE